MASTTTSKKALVIEKDPRYVQFIKSFEKGLYNYDFEKTLQKVQDLHQELTVKGLSRKSLKKGGVDKLISASTKNQAYRSTIVGHLVQASQFYGNLNYEYLLIRNYLLQKYPEKWEDLRTKEERLRAVESLFEPVLQLIFKYTQLLENIRLVLDDIDKAAWQIKNIIEIVKLTSGTREYNV